MRIKWKNEELPDFFLAFILCSASGLRLPSLVPDAAHHIAAKSSLGRKLLRSMRNDQEEKVAVDEDEMASKVTRVGDMTAQLNRSTAAVESLVDISRQNHRLKVLKESKLATEQQLAMLERLGRQDSDQYKTAAERFLSLLQLIRELADAQVTGNNDHA